MSEESNGILDDLVSSSTTYFTSRVFSVCVSYMLLRPSRPRLRGGHVALGAHRRSDRAARGSSTRTLAGNVLIMLQTVGIHSNMRRISSGEACSLSQRRMLRRQLCAAFDVVSEAQYQCLLTLFDIGLAANGPDVSVGYLSAPYELLAALGRKLFACNRLVCCNRQLKVSCTTATIYERDVCYVALHVVKRCRDLTSGPRI